LAARKDKTLAELKAVQKVYLLVAKWAVRTAVWMDYQKVGLLEFSMELSLVAKLVEERAHVRVEKKAEKKAELMVDLSAV